MQNKQLKISGNGCKIKNLREYLTVARLAVGVDGWEQHLKTIKKVEGYLFFKHKYKLIKSIDD